MSHAIGPEVFRGNDSFLAAERARIQAHLSGVEADLRRRSVAEMPSDLQESRLRHLDRLHEYWVQGQFPRNTDFPGQWLPHIRDRYGTLCAMAYLIDRDGGSNLVETLARTNNLVDIDEVTDGPLVAWLVTSGLTQEEAARIQPSYPWDPPPQPPSQLPSLPFESRPPYPPPTYPPVTLPPPSTIPDPLPPPAAPPPPAPSIPPSVPSPPTGFHGSTVADFDISSGAVPTPDIATPAEMLGVFLVLGFLSLYLLIFLINTGMLSFSLSGYRREGSRSAATSAPKPLPLGSIATDPRQLAMVRLWARRFGTSAAGPESPVIRSASTAPS